MCKLQFQQWCDVSQRLGYNACKNKSCKDFIKHLLKQVSCRNHVNKWCKNFKKVPSYTRMKILQLLFLNIQSSWLTCCQATFWKTQYFLVFCNSVISSLTCTYFQLNMSCDQMMVQNLFCFYSEWNALWYILLRKFYVRMSRTYVTISHSSSTNIN